MVLDFAQGFRLLKPPKTSLKQTSTINENSFFKNIPKTVFKFVWLYKTDLKQINTLIFNKH